MDHQKSEVTSAPPQPYTQTTTATATSQQSATVDMMSNGTEHGGGDSLKQQQQQQQQQQHNHHNHHAAADTAHTNANNTNHSNGGVGHAMPTTTTTSSSSSFQLDTLQMCCDEGEFTDTFDAATFIAEKRKYVSLETIRNDLTSLSAQLHKNVVGLVHESVFDFVSVCGKLSHTDQDIRKAMAPLSEVKNRNGAVRHRLEASTKKLNGMLQELHSIDAAAHHYELVREAVELLERMSSHRSTGQRDEQEDKSSNITRMAVDVGRSREVRACWGSGAVLGGEYDSLVELLLGHEEAFNRELTATLVTAMRSQDRVKIAECLVAARLMANEALATETFRESIVRPCVEGVLTWKASSNARSSPSEVAALLPALVDAITSQCLSVVEVSREVSSGFNFLSRGVWACVCDTILKRMSYLFAPGVTETFQHNFRVGMSFVRRIEAMCTTEEELKALRTCPDMVLWHRKWNVDVYFTLRHSDMQTKVDGCLKKAGTPAAEALRSAVSTILAWPYDADIFLPPLAPRLTRAAMTALLRVAHHVKSDVLPKAPALECHALIDTVRTVMETDLAVGFNDAARRQLGELYDASLVTQVGTSILEPLAGAVAESLITGLAEQCCGRLAQMRSIKAAYSMTKKPVPTMPSPYVANCLEPLSVYREKAQQLPRSSSVDEWVLEAMRRVTLRFRGMIVDLLQSVRKAQESLSKYKQMRRTGHTAASHDAQHSSGTTTPTTLTGVRPTADQMSDRDKIFVQLYLDAEEYGTLLRRFGVHKESYGPYGELLQVVQRGRWLLGGDIPEPTDDDFVLATAAAEQNNAKK
eukprot:PhM_4_TR17038/c2_g1_i1/m.94598/K20289/COG2; conserved oligomeric Golgi complex subunit 2